MELPEACGEDESQTEPDLNVPSPEIGQLESLSPTYVLVEQRIGYVASAIVLTVVLSITIPIYLWAIGVWWGRLLVGVGWVLLLVNLVWFSHFWPALSYKYVHWRLSDVGFEIYRGVLFRHRIAIPVARVQHIDVTQGPIQRLANLAKITIHTAGTTNAAIELDGLQHAVAMRLRDKLIAQKASADVI